MDPFKISKTQIVLPTHLTPRITAQWGIFTIHPRPNKEFNPINIERIIIINHVRKELKRCLYLMGVHDASIFPDVEGVASFTKWLKTNKY